MAESREIGSKKSGFCAIVERLSCTTMQYIGLHLLKVDGVPIDRHKVKSTSRVFGNGPVQTAPLLEFFETTLDHRSKPQEILGFQLGHLMANYSRIHLPECVHKVLMTEFMLELSTSRAGESPWTWLIYLILLSNSSTNSFTIWWWKLIFPQTTNMSM